mgnify:CR=1 FL=1
MNKKNKITGIILAAGRGRRLKNFELPKSLIKYKNKYLIEHIINNFEKNHINNINIITGYKKKVIEKNTNVKSYLHNKFWRKTNMVYSLTKADKVLSKNYSIISYADIYYSSELINEIKKKKYDICIASYLNWKKLWRKRFKDPLNDLEGFRRNGNKLLDIGFNERNLKDIEGQYMGVIGISSKGWKLIKKNLSKYKNEDLKKISFTELLKKLIFDENLNIKIIDYSKKFFEIDFQNDLKFML